MVAMVASQLPSGGTPAPHASRGRSLADLVAHLLGAREAQRLRVERLRVERLGS